MKVLKKADVSNWSYKHTCSGCDSELQIEAADISYRYYDGDMREPGYDSYSTNCCVCSASINVPGNKIPKLLQVEIKNRTNRRSSNYFDR